MCIQHEMDHLLGKVFVEYLSPLKRNRIKTKMLKARRETESGLSPSCRRSLMRTLLLLVIAVLLAGCAGISGGYGIQAPARRAMP